MSQTKKVAPKLTGAQKKEVESLGSMAAKIRYLDSEGYARADIARILSTPKKPVIYQWVRNVLTTEAAKNTAE